MSEDVKLRTMEGFTKGVNLGGWISQFDKYDKEHFDTFITKKDIDYIASLGFDHVRVPVDYVLFEEEDGTPKEDGFHYLDNCRAWCAENNLKMLMDLHECYGYSFDPLKDVDREKFFYDDALQARFLNLWKRIAEHFKAYQDQMAFEPLNEVVLMEVAEAWNKVAAEYIKTVRAICPDIYLVIGGVCYSNVQSVPLLDLPMDDKVVYNFHCYEPFIFTHQGAYWVENMPSDFRTTYPKTLAEYRRDGADLAENLAGAIFKEGIGEIGDPFFEDIFAPAIEKAAKDNACLYCGEYGAIDIADPESRLYWMRDIHKAFHRHNIGFALWNYKEKDFGLVDESFAKVADRFIEIL
ncbi:MAG: glycoside hydrolase family 5 protein [Lachnospiraceae bacterium]|nr:glycoside hydrolase family 5 protein [Lachnospiraceae bacterium]